MKLFKLLKKWVTILQLVGNEDEIIVMSKKGNYIVGTSKDLQCVAAYVMDREKNIKEMFEQAIKLVELKQQLLGTGSIKDILNGMLKMKENMTETVERKEAN